MLVTTERNHEDKRWIPGVKAQNKLVNTVKLPGNTNANTNILYSFQFWNLERFQNLSFHSLQNTNKIFPFTVYKM